MIIGENLARQKKMTSRHSSSYILGLNFLSPILSVLPLNCFTSVGTSHYYTYIYASYVMYEYN